MTTTTTPDGIVGWDQNDPSSIVAESQAQAASIQLALDKRERYDFVWPTQSQRTSQTGMTQGSRGYQVDTKSEYIYDNLAWRLSASHAEFTAKITGIGDTGGVPGVGVFSLDSSKTTDSTFISPTATAGKLTIVQPGLYAVSSVTTLLVPGGSTPQPVTGRCFLDLSFVQSAADLQRISINVGEDRGSLSCPNVRSTASNQDLWVQVFKVTGGNCDIATRLRITRIG